MGTVNFAIVGPGLVAEHHSRALESLRDEGAHLAAVCHYDPDRFDAIGERFGVSCLGFEEALGRDDIDAICLCTPSGMHAEQAIAAARAGKHVLVEKPMALSLEDADRMIAACEEAGVQLGVVYQRRAERKFRALYEQIQEERLGRLTLGSLSMHYRRDQAYYDQAPWRGTWAQDGGGVLMNQGIHLVDLLVWYMGDPVDVQAQAGTLEREIEVEDVLASTLKFADGSLATVAATTTAGRGAPHRFEITGTEGGAEIHGEEVRTWTLDETEAETLSSDDGEGEREAGAAEDPASISLAGHRGILLDFMQAIRENRPPLIDGSEGRRSLRAVLAIYDAAGIRRQAAIET